MSKISLEPNASGAGTFTLAAPNSNTNRTLTLPDESGAIFSDGTGVPGSAVTGQLASSNMPAGSVIQLVQGSANAEVVTSSTSYVDTGLEANITPLFIDSKILIVLTQKLQADDAGSNYRLARLLENGTTIHEDTRIEGGVSSPSRYTWSLAIISTPSTTSQVTYKTQFRTNAGDGQIQAQHVNTPSYLTLMEIAG